MALDLLASLRSDGARAVAALDAGRERPIPWSDSWTVQACAGHLGHFHRALTRIVEGRPDKEWSAFAEVTVPDLADPGLGAWMAEGVEQLAAVLEAVPATEACWSWWPGDMTVGFWLRRAAHETYVHRWDLEHGAGLEIAPADPALASDGIDEYLEVFLGVSRMVNGAPGAGESVHVHCTDTEGEWLVRFPAPGELAFSREHAKGDLALRGPAEGLLLDLWGRIGVEAAGAEAIGDTALLGRWTELFPPM